MSDQPNSNGAPVEETTKKGKKTKNKSKVSSVHPVNQSYLSAMTFIILVNFIEVIIFL